MLFRFESRLAFLRLIDVLVRGEERRRNVELIFISHLLTRSTPQHHNNCQTMKKNLALECRKKEKKRGEREYGYKKSSLFL